LNFGNKYSSATDLEKQLGLCIYSTHAHLP
jgi:hypothetical protein